MSIILAAIGKHDTVSYAQEELFRCLRRMDPSLLCELRHYDKKDGERRDILWIGLDGSIPYSELDTVEAVSADGTRTAIIAGGRFVLPGTEELNAPLLALEAEGVKG